MPGLMDARYRSAARPLAALGGTARLAADNQHRGVAVHADEKQRPRRALDACGAYGAAQRRRAAAALTTAIAPRTAIRRTAASHFSPLDSAPVYAPEIPLAAATGSAAAGSAPPAARPPVPYVAPLRSPATRAGARALRRPDPVLTDADAGADNDEVLPSISEINLTGAQALPELHLDVHVYATNPADRFVYINMRKYHEGITAAGRTQSSSSSGATGWCLNYPGSAIPAAAAIMRAAPPAARARRR